MPHFATTDGSPTSVSDSFSADLQEDDVLQTSAVFDEGTKAVLEVVTLANSEEDAASQVDELLKQSDLTDPNLPPGSAESADPIKIVLSEVVSSVHRSYPLLEVAYLENTIANANQLAAWGAFDTKFKGSSENGPVGFYPTYRQGVGFQQPMYAGGEVFAGYRVGRGSFQPWFRERNTNDGGEFKTGILMPLARNRDIDERRANLWRATYDVQRTQPEIRAQLIWFVRDASVAYWKWVAAGRQYDVGERALHLSEERNSKLKRRVDEGDLDPPVLQDNLRSIALRESKLIDRRRKLRQAAIKLSLYYRTIDGAPLVPKTSQLADFPTPDEIQGEQLESDIQLALSQRPELAALDAMSRKVNVDLAEAQNNFLPSVDAQFAGSQDVGAPTSKKRDKSRFELEAGLFVDVPLQRRKASGKAQAAEAKLAQISIKRSYTQDKIVADIQTVYAALSAAYERLDKAREAKRLAEYLADVERRKFDLGQSDLLSVFLREQYAIEAADGEVEALLEYFAARADYAAALALDWPLGVEE